MITTLVISFLIILSIENYIKARQYKKLINRLYWQVADNQTTTKENIYMADKTEAQKAQEVADAYNALKADVAADQTTITQLQAQIAAGNPVTADQLAALNIVDTTAAEVEADNAAANPAPVDPSAPADPTA